jgi:plastocyanin
MNLSLLIASLLAVHGAPPSPTPAWLGTEMPLPLSVRTPADLAFKALAERQYLLFNLLAQGKWEWDHGDYAGAAEKWEALLRVPNLPPDLAQGVAAFATEARSRAGGKAAAPVAAAPGIEQSPRSESRAARMVNVRGQVVGGGSSGPGGSVVWLERRDGPTPRPRVGRDKVIAQKDKTFVPQVTVVPVGTEVQFRNDDDLFHDVFSLSKPNDFDLGLYKGGTVRVRQFNAPGPVELLCNIHATMQAWVYVVDSPWYGMADASGAFSIRSVPAGNYLLKAWHPSSAKVTEQPLRVEPDLAPVQVAVGGGRGNAPFVPDKYGKPRQVQLGY